MITELRIMSNKVMRMMNNYTNEGRRLKDELEKLKNRISLQEWRLKNIQDSDMLGKCPYVGREEMTEVFVSVMMFTGKINLPSSFNSYFI